MTKALDGENLPKDLEIREYIYDMPTVIGKNVVIGSTFRWL